MKLNPFDVCYDLLLLLLLKSTTTMRIMIQDISKLSYSNFSSSAFLLHRMKLNPFDVCLILLLLRKTDDDDENKQSYIDTVIFEFSSTLAFRLHPMKSNPFDFCLVLLLLMRKPMMMTRRTIKVILLRTTFDADTIEEYIGITKVSF